MQRVVRERSFGDTCRFLKKSGYDGVEVAPFTLAPRMPTSRASVDPSCASWRRMRDRDYWIALAAGRYQGLYLTSPDEGVNRRRPNTSSVSRSGARPRRRSHGLWIAQAAFVATGRLTAAGVRLGRGALQAGDAPGRRLRHHDLHGTAPTAETDFINTCAEARS